MPPRQAKAHLISVIGGDTQLAAISAGVSLSGRFMVEGPGMAPTRVCLDRNAEIFKGSIQLSCRKKPLRHLVAVSEEFATSNASTTSAKALLASSDALFVWASIADIYGVPGIPEWAEWFEQELKTHHAIVPALGIGCNPAIIRGEKEHFLDWLNWGIESQAIRFPGQSGSVVWPAVSLREVFRPAG
jgi:hypothetical protein